MASIGVVVKRTRAPEPFHCDYNRRVYTIERNVTQVLLEAIKRSG